jgi:hypothetical protein
VIQTTATAADNFVRSGLFIADVPSGSTGDIVVSRSGTCNNMGISVWAADGLASASASDTATDATDALNLDIDTTTGGIAVALGVVGTSGPLLPRGI